MTEGNKYLDTLFQSKFTGFEAEPPAQVWDNIHAELHDRKGGSINPVNLATIAALVLISGLLSFSFMKDSPYHAQQALSSDQNFTIGENPGTLAHYVPPAPSQDNKQAASSMSIDEKPSGNHGNDPANSNITGASVHQTEHANSAGQEISAYFSEELMLAKLRNRKSFGVHAGLELQNTGISIRNGNDKPRYFSQGENQRKYNRKAAWQLGILLTPAISYYPDDSINSQRSITFDASIKWTRKEFFIESGLGISFAKDDGKYNIDYEKFLGSYDDVYNVTFDTTESGAVVPVYHTNEVNVYDSISRYKVEQTQNRYTYLQVPLYVGFNKDVNRFGWFIKGGPVFSLLIHENIPQPDAGNDRIVGLDQHMAARVKTYWQFAISAGMSYQLSNKVSITIEPTFRYFLNSQYERKYISTRHPYSIGLRTGLLFNF
ncbi:MAG TPA: hypothetical protein VK994_00610 [Bacteroidales bacterium]|nr:hypothetical protein [Bacteroidales bacterium]